MKNPKYRFCT